MGEHELLIVADPDHDFARVAGAPSVWKRVEHHHSAVVVTWLIVGSDVVVVVADLASARIVVAYLEV